ncbi:hypothetical protein [Proteus sp. FME41]|uniref:hypothetical protein n=1 Tax=Proteus sp. FME41 TaxID=2742608 RepID=UPI001D0290F6|nr:hypothetical protein [Proteus sp. FME41]
MMIYLYSGGGSFEKQKRVNQVAADKAQEIAVNKMKQVAKLEALTDISMDTENIGAILLIEPSIALACAIGRQYSHSVDVVIAESAEIGKKLTVCQIEFSVIKMCVL